MVADGPELNLFNVLLSSLPILTLVVTIMGLKWSAPKAGALSWLVAVVVAFMFFGSDAQVNALGSLKGLSLSLFILTIIWSSVFLYNVVDRLGGIDVIGNTMTRLVRDPLAQALVVGWAFSGFMQGIAGFGVPIAVVAPLMVLMGFSPVKAVAIVLVGHAWAVAFGSMGAAFYAIQLVTDISAEDMGPYMALLIALPIIFTGFAVAHLQGGMASVRRGFGVILIVGSTIAFSVWIMAKIGSPQIASVVPGLVGCGLGWLICQTRLIGGPRSTVIAKDNLKLETGSSFHMACIPYYFLLMFSILSQIAAVKVLGAELQFGLNYPATETSLGYKIAAQDNYARIGMLHHPAPLILLSLTLTYLIYTVFGKWNPGTMMGSLKRTYNQCVSTSLGVATMLMMALVMTDTGMTVLLGKTIAGGTGPVFALFSPYIGVLGTFMTGSNTSSNVMFGLLQLEAAQALGISAVTVVSVQSIGGSIGSAIAPAKVMVGTAMVGLSGKEYEVMRRTAPYCLGIVLMVGVEALVISQLVLAK